MKSSFILDAVNGVTKKWEKQRKAEERNSRAYSSRRYYSDRINFTEIAHQILPKAYEHASGNGQYTVFNRQLYYASREEFRKVTGREINADYFTQTILRQYLNRYKPGWKIAADPRGNLTVPNSSFDVRIACGTIAIDQYLDSRHNDDLKEVERFPVEWPTLAEGERYRAVLYIEKEGFEPILNEAKIAERFDLAILGCKGQSVTAARKFVDHVCRKDGGVPLLVMHDFDKAGFEIVKNLTSVSSWAVLNDRVAYDFENEVNFVDLGLRLEDAKKYKLQNERTDTEWFDREGLVMTDEEFDYLSSGKRVELNAFTAPQLLEWLEAKLVQHLGRKRLIPDDDTLAKAYQRATLIARVNTEIERLKSDFEEVDCDVKQLRRLLNKEMQSDPNESFNPPTWDRALYDIAERHDCERTGDQEEEA
jgi:hypothetical protein